MGWHSKQQSHTSQGSSLFLNGSVYCYICFLSTAFSASHKKDMSCLHYSWFLSSSSIFKTVVWSLGPLLSELSQELLQLVHLFLWMGHTFLISFLICWCLVMFFMKMECLTVTLYLWKSDFPLVQGLTFFVTVEGCSSPPVSWVCSTVTTENVFLGMVVTEDFLNLCSESVLTEISLNIRRQKIERKPFEVFADWLC